MLRKNLLLAFSALLLAGCATTLTNLTPLYQTRNDNNLYPVEVALSTRQQTMRWRSIHPQIVVGSEIYEMRQTLLMTNRWEGLVPVPPGVEVVHYRYKFNFMENAFGPPQPNSVISRDYTLHVVNQ